MANYIGNQPLNGEFKVLDSIESQFNNSSTSFGLKYNTASQTVGDAAQLIVSLNGVIQQPLTSYTLSGVTNIVFASPPSSGDTCFIVLLGGIGGTVTPSDNSVTTEKLTNSSVTSAKIVNNTITADDMDSSDSYAFAGVNVGSTFVTDTVNDRIGVGTTNPTYPLDVEDDGAGFIKGSFVSTGSAHSSISFDNTGSAAASVRVGSNNDDFYVRTSGSEKLRVTSAGDVGIGTNSPSKKLSIQTSTSYDGVLISNTHSSSAARLQLNNDDSKSLQIDVGGSTQSTYGPYVANTVAIVANSAPLNIGTDTANQIAFFTNLNERMRIDSSGNVIKKVPDTSTNGGIAVNNGTYDAIALGTGGYGVNGGTFTDGGIRAYNNLLFATGSSSSERMRIDSSGNLLVGTTSTGAASGGSGTSGININASGAIEVSRSANPVMFINRTTSDGDIMQFRKDGTTVGTIGFENGDFNIDGSASHSGLRFQAGSIMPRLNGVDSSGTIDLGYNDTVTTYAFKNLTLSGGIYLGGFGSANYLDDYESGTWTPVFRGANTAGSYTYGEQQGHYIKIGDQVTAWCNLSDIATTTAGSGIIQISGLPFAANWMSGFNGDAVGSFSVNGFTGIDGDYIMVVVPDNTSSIFLYKQTGTNNNTTAINVTDKVGSGSDCRGFVTYYVGG